VPKLNLDIFSSEEPIHPKETPMAEQIERQSADRHEIAAEMSDVRHPNESGPRFIPVGFYRRQLCALDDAVVRLRRSGYWKASKSAIIRNLIEAHAGELDKFGRGDKDRMSEEPGR
jgi:hypothetical protein